MDKDLMTIMFAELCEIIASAKSLPTDFWKNDPLYIKLGSYAERTVAESEPFAVKGGSDISIDLTANGEALGIEFMPV